MQEDEEGFLYPHVDKENCINCGLCEKVCPVINQSEPHKPLKVYAAKNPNEEIRMASSSGGIFTLLAERTINNGGVVFGAKFNDKWEVVHDFTETVEGIAPFRGSKYVQSTIGDNFQKAEQFLKQGREVLFTGTPCQIAGLHKYLRKDYSNLIAVDVVCHGVPSPLVWREYLKEISGNETLKSISFRDKSTGWKSYSTKYAFKDKCIMQKASKDIYIQGFLKNLYLRPSCYACPSKAGKSESDITIADYWGIQVKHQELDDDKGVGLILVNNEKGLSLFRVLNIDIQETSYEDAFIGNQMIERSVISSKYRMKFWHNYEINGIGEIAIMCNKIKSISHIKERLRKFYYVYKLIHNLFK